MIALEFFNPDKHYETVSQWWIAQKWPVIPLTHLSQTGIVVTYEGKPAAAAWIYKSDSALSMLEWVVADPEIRREKRAAVLSVLISSAKMISKTMGFHTLFTSVRQPTLGARLEGQGFQATDRGMTNFVCNLQGGE